MTGVVICFVATMDDSASPSADFVFASPMQYIKEKWDEYVKPSNLNTCIVLLNTSFGRRDSQPKQHLILKLEDEYSEVSQEFVYGTDNASLIASVCQRYRRYQGAKPVFYLLDNISNPLASLEDAADLAGVRMRVFVVIIANKFSDRFPLDFYDNTAEIGFCLGQEEYDRFATGMVIPEEARAERTLRSLFPRAKCTYFNQVLLFGKSVGEELGDGYTSQWRNTFSSIRDVFDRICEDNSNNATPLIIEVFLNQVTALEVVLNGSAFGNILKLLSSAGFCIDHPILPTYSGLKISPFQSKRLHLSSVDHPAGSPAITGFKVDWSLVVTESCLHAAYLATWSIFSNRPIREYLFGMVGIGKSFVLLFTAIYLKTCEKDRAIVVYVPDADSFVSTSMNPMDVELSQINVIIAELVFAFSGHDIAVEISAQMVPPIVGPAKVHLGRVLEVIGTYVISKGLRVFFIIDQVTFIFILSFALICMCS
jgi:hypothetical protein